MFPAMALAPVNADTIAARFPALAGRLEHDDLIALAEAVELRRFAAGDQLLTQGSPFPTLFFLWDGRFALGFGEEESAADLGVLPPNAIVGEVSFFDGGPVTATVVAITRSAFALALTPDAFDVLAVQRPTAATGLLHIVCGMLAERLRTATERHDRLMAERGDTRGILHVMRGLFGLRRSA